MNLLDLYIKLSTAIGIDLVIHVILELKLCLCLWLDLSLGNHPYLDLLLGASLIIRLA